MDRARRVSERERTNQFGLPRFSFSAFQGLFRPPTSLSTFRVFYFHFLLFWCPGPPPKIKFGAHLPPVCQYLALGFPRFFGQLVRDQFLWFWFSWDSKVIGLR